MTSEYTTLLVRREHGNLHVTLNRPQVRNAMNDAMVAELTSIFRDSAQDRTLRTIILHGAGGTFCAGGDIKDMGTMMAGKPGEDDPARVMNRAFGTLIELADRSPQAVIAVMEGAVMGGGFGLACVSDYALAHVNTKFALPETSLGIPPAQIAAFVVRRIGLTQARRMAVCGARFDANQAQKLGVVHDVFHSEAEAAEMVEGVLRQIHRCAPGANAVTKQLMLDVGVVPLEQLLDRAAEDFATCLRGPEGQEGTRAFREKRAPKWAGGEP